MNRIIKAVETKNSNELKKMTNGSSIPSSSKSCGKCENGWIFLPDRQGVRKCECLLKREAMHKIKRSGLDGVIDRLTFDSFEAKLQWQKPLLNTAKNYVDAVSRGDTPWLFIGGQVGSGKTHICTAVSGELLKLGIGVQYVIWSSEVRKIKAFAMDMEHREKIMAPMLNAKVLYIDDFFKSDARGNYPKVTDADITVAFEIFNERYYRSLPTIISCEWTLEQLMEVDQATASRIYQMSTGYQLSIEPDKSKNYRTRGLAKP